MRRTWLFALVLAVLGTAGCGLVLSKHPLSTEAGSTLDERLIGFWETAPAKGAEQESQQRLLVGRLAGHPQLLELVAMSLDEERQVKIDRFVLRSTKIAGSWYLSWSDKKAEQFLLIRYQVHADGTLSLGAMEQDDVAKAIGAKQIAGKVTLDAKAAASPAGETKYKDVTLTASTKALRAWIAKAADGLWTQTDRRLIQVDVQSFAGGD